MVESFPSAVGSDVWNPNERSWTDSWDTHPLTPVSMSCTAHTHIFLHPRAPPHTPSVVTNPSSRTAKTPNDYSILGHIDIQGGSLWLRPSAQDQSLHFVGQKLTCDAGGTIFLDALVS